ncbi:MAG: glycoside hydrolase family 2 protein [Ruminococcaceae bacterium]|jgi:beta-galactosidase|nr:glycoside hydrolase family 2 protein [Oscillospiraceae bacterium]
MAQRIAWNRDWQFTEDFDDFTGARTVSLPHTCRETPYDYFDEGAYQMVCGYRKTLRVPEAWAGKRVFLCVGAAGHGAEVFLDGVKYAEHRCGYTAFRVELTAGLTPGKEAEVKLRVDSRETQDIPPFGYVIDYMTYGGLYREVWLEVTEQTYIEDVFARPALSGVVYGTVTLAGEVRNGMALRQCVDGSEKRTDVSGGKTETSLYVPGAKPWSLRAPNLYTLVTELTENGRVLDRVETRIGFREAAWRADGFYLNGEKVKLLGLNRHQSYPYVGYAMPKSMQRYDAEILKNELGCNAVRTSHYPQSQHFIDRCDELGLLVFTEIPGWQHIGESDQWREQAVENVREMVTQYRNHPSVILWGVRINESQDDDVLYTRTNALARTLDPTRATGGVRYLKKSSLLEDVYTYNDFVHDGKAKGCEKKKDVTPDVEKPYLVSEYNGHMYPTKTYDSEEHRLEHALRHANVIDAIAAEDDIAGGFGWCMFDYNTHRDFGSGDRVCYHGVLDMFRNPKLAADVYSAQREGEPFLSVSSAFDIGEHPASNRGRVVAFTNADEVRMYKNGRFIRSYTHADTVCKHMKNPPIEIDDFIGGEIAESGEYAPLQAQYIKDILNHSARFGGKLSPEIAAKAGVLMARWHMTPDDAYQLYGKYVSSWGSEAMAFKFEAVKDGAVVATVVKAPAAERRLRVNASHTALAEGETYDVAALRIALVDQNGNVLPFAQEPVTLTAEGPIEIIGPQTAMLRGGLGGTYVKTKGLTGSAALTLSIDGAELVTISFTIDGEGKGE